MDKHRLLIGNRRGRRWVYLGSDGPCLEKERSGPLQLWEINQVCSFALPPSATKKIPKLPVPPQYFPKANYF